MKVLASKIHYDHRKRLPLHLKYSKVLTQNEYDSFLQLYYDEGIGGEGFHECLNFNKSCDNVKIYLPPGYIPNETVCKDELLLFSFTYKGDKELPARVIGVHANVRILNRKGSGIKRRNINLDKDIPDLCYHAVSPSNMSTLFSSPLEYNFKEGKYTPIYAAWGNGLRYLDNSHAISILNNALEKAKENHLIEKSKSKIQFIEEEIEVISKILNELFGVKPKKDEYSPKFNNNFGLPDKEIGHLGEEYIYNKELEYANENNIDLKNVEWLSQSVPTSVCDIKTIRKKGKKIEEYYLEVKSTKQKDFDNIYISSRQIEFFEDNPNNSFFVFIKFDEMKKPIETKFLSIDELKKEFNLNPIKYKISQK